MNEPMDLVLEAQDFIRGHRAAVDCLLRRLAALDRPFLLRSDVLDIFDGLCREGGREGGDEGAGVELAEGPFGRLLQGCQEVAIGQGQVCFALRTRVARWFYLAIDLGSAESRLIPVEEFLRFKERLAGEGDGGWVLEIDLAPFARGDYRLQEEDSIGRGMEFLNRRLSSRLFDAMSGGDRRLLDFLRLHRVRDRQLMLRGHALEDIPALRNALRRADQLLRRRPRTQPWEEIAADLFPLGFEAGWGRDVERVRETMRLLLDLLEAPSPQNLERFIGRVPMIFSLAILSPHGFFGQENVLGRPDTGGQVVYILDQVRALEREMRTRLDEQGLDIEPRIVVVTRLIPEAEGTTCNERIEPIRGTRNARILRVPFREPSGNVVPHWISRFEVWPYLERFSLEVERELLGELGGRPDLIVGNYSDGNLVASLLAGRLGVTQCNIAHALEKTKYLYSDLFWRHNDERYHFSCQFTADLIAMNAADFIITSTYQEIAGTPENLGQYESHMHFSLPGLYRVVQGVDVYDPRFNIVSPGADAEVYFPFDDTGRRRYDLHGAMERLVFGQDEGADRRGVLAEAGRPLLFTMARLDRIKNITGLVEWYAQHPRLREQANLLVVAGHVDPNDCGDDEEREQALRMHELIDRHGLAGQVRWLGMHLDKAFCGELYRFVADRRGAFVQPALFEAFGLTVIEAMASGLPTFATLYGGPLEVIEDGSSGFHIDPNHGDQAAERISAFLATCAADPTAWDAISRGGLARVEERYTWRHYAERLMTLARVYGFWRFVTDLERADTKRYLEMFYGLGLRPRAAAMERGGATP